MDNYLDTLYRMYKSSNILFKEKDFHNASYLAGYVLECYLKSLIKKEKKVHDLEELINYIEKNSSISVKLQRINFENIKKDWKVSKRYTEKSNEWQAETAKKMNCEIKSIMKNIANENINTN